MHTSVSTRLAALRLLSLLVLAALLVGAAGLGNASAQSVRPPSDATKNVVPGEPGVAREPGTFDKGPESREAFGNTQGNSSDADFWSTLRHGAEATTAVQGPQAGYVIQSSGESYRQFRNGDLATYGWWALAGITALCLVYYLIVGPVRIVGGRSGRVIERFALSERTGHWLLAISFLILAVTGLNMLYGRYTLLPLMGPEAFGTMTLIGKWAHHISSATFVVGLVWVVLKWLPDNIPHWSDFVWLAKGGGFFSKDSHPPAKKFNAGQKAIFWLVVLMGASTTLSGIALLMPFEFAMFAKTFAAINGVFGTDLPTQFTALQEMQLHQLWHAIVALMLTAVIVAHIYIGTIGMEGGFEAMGSGKVDLNWAREHHSLWVEELEKKGELRTVESGTERPGAGAQQPAE